jgi:hypothetical protein
MKASALKKLIKEAVKEAIQEELKDVLLEAVRSPKSVVTQNTSDQRVPIQESITSTTPPPVSLSDKRQSYLDIIGETGLNMKSGDAQGFGNQPFNPQGSIDTTSPNGKLPEGEVGMDQIMNLMVNK